MSDFSDRPFVAGSLVGLRAFAVDKYGRLIGPAFGGVFKPGENQAECHNTKHLFAGIPGGAFVDHEPTVTTTFAGPSFQPPRVRHSRLVLRHADGTEERFSSPQQVVEKYPPPPSDHPAGSADCTCGYYAYFDGSNDYDGAGRVTAVVEGYGVCTVGDRGFRASTARVVAFVKPEPKPEPEEEIEQPSKLRRAMRRVFPNWWNGSLIAFNIVVGGRAALRGEWWWQATLNAACAALIGVVWLMSLYSKKRLEYHRARSSPLAPVRSVFDDLISVDWSLVQRNYPDVPTYPSIKAALVAHPLTTPPKPTPDDDDFWTREVPR